MNPMDQALVLSTRSAAGWRAWRQDWSELCKLRLTSLVLLTTLVGMYCGSAGRLAPLRTVFTLFGTMLVAAAAAVLNEWIERDLDAKMERTAQRPLPMGRISPDEALLGGALMAATGLAILYFGVYPPVAFLAAATLALYLFVYTPMKRWTVLNTLVGAVPGAIPPLLGFMAGRGSLGAEGWALFSILFLWQIPHFLSIAWRYRADYRRAGFRMLPCSDEQGRVTGLVSTLYCVVLLVVVIWPFYLGAAGPWYLGGAVALSLGFTAAALGFTLKPTPDTARYLFLASVAYLPTVLILLVADRR